MTTEHEPEGPDDLDDLMDAVGAAIDLIPVPVAEGPTGAKFTVLTEAEKEYYESSAARYQKDNIFTNISDLRELERILGLETMVYRWTQWSMEEKDYFGDPVNVGDLQKQVKDYSGEIRLIKKSLGIDKATREKDHGETVAEYIANLRRRALEFGFMRNEQSIKAITLWQELVGVVTFHLNSNADERNEFHANESDVIKWVVDHIAEFEAIDRAFRQTSQSLWIREL
jgi:hypothetical protein